MSLDDRNGFDFDFAIHHRPGYQHSLYSEQAFVITGKGNYDGGVGGWEYGTHNNMLNRIRDRYSDNSTVGCVRGTLENTELQLFPFFPWENGLSHYRLEHHKAGYISKQAARKILAYIAGTDYNIKTIWLEFVNTGEFNGPVEEGIKVLKRVRKNTEEGRRYR